MVKCKKSVPKAVTKGNCLGLQKSSYSSFLLLNVTFWPILACSFRHLGAGLARISFRDLVFDMGKSGFWAPRSDEIVYSGIIGLIFLNVQKKGLILRIWYRNHVEGMWNIGRCRMLRLFCTLPQKGNGNILGYRSRE